MGPAEFHIQGSFKGGSDVGRVEFDFWRGPEHIIYQTEKFPPPNGIMAQWLYDESIHATTDEMPRAAIMKAIHGPNGWIAPGDYAVTFDSYENIKWSSIPLKTTDEKPVRGVITIEYQDEQNLGHCRIDESAIANLLSQLTHSGAKHRNYRLPDRQLALFRMMQFLDPEGVARCADRQAVSFGKLWDKLQLQEPCKGHVFRQVHHFTFNLIEFRARMKNPSGTIMFRELRDWLLVEDETLRSWLIEAELASSDFHGQSYKLTIKQFLDNFVPSLVSRMPGSRVGDKISAALQRIDLAP